MLQTQRSSCCRLKYFLSSRNVYCSESTPTGKVGVAAKERGRVQATGGPAGGPGPAATEQPAPGRVRPPEEIRASGAGGAEGETNRRCSPQGTPGRYTWPVHLAGTPGWYTWPVHLADDVDRDTRMALCLLVLNYFVFVGRQRRRE